MALPVSFYSVTLNDYTLKQNGTPEDTNFRLPITTNTGGNLAAVATAIAALNAAVIGVTNGQLAKSTQVYLETLYSAAAASSPLAQRENKWLVRGHSATTSQKSSFSIGTADLSLLANNSEMLVLGSGAGLALKDALEDIWVSPYDSSQLMIVDSVQFVGRNT